MAAQGNRRSHVRRRNSFHHAIDRQNHERQQDVHHRDVHTHAVEHQFQRLVDHAHAHQGTVDQATRLQQHNPGRDPHQDRGPERQQHQDHQQVALARRQVGQQVRQRIGQHQADGGNDQAHPEGTGKNVQVDRLVRRGRGQFAQVIDAVVDRCQQVERCDGAGVTADRLPVGRVAPTLVKLLHGFFIGSRLSLERQGASGFCQQAAVAGQLHVQALGKITQGLILARFSQVFAQSLVYRLIRQALAIPVGYRGHGTRQAAHHFRVTDALVEQRNDRHQENQQQEQHQRCDQGLGFPAIDPLGVGQALFQAWAGFLFQGHCDGHSELRNLEQRGASPTGDTPAARVTWQPKR
ncbi:hypothetical protein D9M71_287910 [compost metagenome]